jgi:peptide/nickel transport system substrate-binding protein
VVPTGLGFSAPTAIESFNPLLSTSEVSKQLQHLILRPLLRLTPDYTIDFPRSLASGIEVRDGGQTYLVSMHPWMWSDGVKVTANDEAYAFGLIKQIGHVYPDYGAGGVPDLVQSLTVLNDHQFEIRMTRPVNPEWFELNGLNEIPPLPQHVWGNISTADLWSRQSDPTMFAVSDGPFVLETVALSRYVSLVPNPHYAGKKPTIGRFVMDFLEGADAFQAFSSGEVDMSDVPFALVGAVRTMPDAELVKTHPAFTYFTLTINFKNDAVDFFRDVRVRQAMADALDQQTMTKVVFRGFAKPLYGPVPAQPPTYLSPDAKAGKYPVGFDPERARALLRAAGFTPGPDGVMQKAGKRLHFEALLGASGTTGPQLASFMQRNFARVGIDMTIKEMEFNQILALAFGPPQRWESAFIGWTINGYPDGQQIFSTQGAENIAHYSDTRMDALVDAVNFGTDRQPLFAWQDYTSEQQPSIFFTNGYIPVVTRPGIAGVRDMINPDGALYPEELTITDPNFCHAAHDHHAS